jgi:hypothetical protein
MKGRLGLSSVLIAALGPRIILFPNASPHRMRLRRIGELYVMAMMTFKHIAKNSLLLIFLGVGVVCSCGGSNAADNWTIPTFKRDTKAESRFHGVTNIVFFEKRDIDFSEKSGVETNDWQRFTVKDPKVIRILLSPIRLDETSRCYCDHIHEAVFEGPCGSVRVSFCDHCFNLMGDRYGYYEMPKDFYAEFRTLAGKHGWRLSP